MYIQRLAFKILILSALLRWWFKFSATLKKVCNNENTNLLLSLENCLAATAFWDREAILWRWYLLSLAKKLFKLFRCAGEGEREVKRFHWEKLNCNAKNYLDKLAINKIDTVWCHSPTGLQTPMHKLLYTQILYLNFVNVIGFTVYRPELCMHLKVFIPQSSLTEISSELLYY